MNWKLGVKRSAHLSYVYQFGVQLSNFLVIPLTVILLSTEERTVWLIFFTISTLNPILLLGFESSVFRASSYLFGGAIELLPTGVGRNHPKLEVDKTLLNDFIISVKLIFRFLSFFILISMIVLGNYYFQAMKAPFSNISHLYLSWIIYAIGLFINNCGIYKDSVLRGMAKQNSLNVALICSRFLFILSGILVLNLFDVGLLGLSVIFLVTMIIQRILIFCIWRKIHISKSSNRNFPFATIQKNFLILLPNSIRTALVFIGVFLTLRVGIMLAPQILEGNIATDYVLGGTLVLGVMGVSTELARVKLPSLHKAQIAKSKNEVKRHTMEMFGVAVVTYLIGLLFVLVIVSIGKRNLIDLDLFSNLYVILIIGLVAFFELIYSLSGIYLSSQNITPIVKSALVSGLLNVAISFILGNKFGAVGLIASQFIVGAAFNYWYWIMKVTKSLDIKLHVQFKRQKL